jgi:hypothetical protein
MRRFFLSACIAACLFGTIACESSVKNLSLSIRKGWKQLTEDQPQKQPVVATAAEREAIGKLDPVPGEPLSEEEQIRLVKAQEFIAQCSRPAMDTATRNKTLRNMAARLDRLYPPFTPISLDSMEDALQSSPPPQIGPYQFVKEMTYGQIINVLDEPVPHGLFYITPGFNYAVSGYGLYDGSQIINRNFYVIDRGNYGGWLRTASWYYLRKGFVGRQDSEQYQFSKTVEIDGRTWVVWSLKGTDRHRFITWWNDRFVVWVEGRELPDDSVDDVINTGWLDLY